MLPDVSVSHNFLSESPPSEQQLVLGRNSPLLVLPGLYIYPCLKYTLALRSRTQLRIKGKIEICLINTPITMELPRGVASSEII